MRTNNSPDRPDIREFTEDERGEWVEMEPGVYYCGNCRANFLNMSERFAEFEDAFANADMPARARRKVSDLKKDIEHYAPRTVRKGNVPYGERCSWCSKIERR